LGIPEKIKAIQEEMARTKVNKATEHHLGLLTKKQNQKKLVCMMDLMSEELETQQLFLLDCPV